MRCAVSVPAENDRGPQYMEQALAAIHQANPRRLPMALEFRRHTGEVTLACRFPEELRAAVEGQLFAQYPDCQILPLPADSQEPSPETKSWEMNLHLRHDLFPIRRFVQFEDSLNR